ncbi:MAG: phosphate ABC transporter substrate-binding protein [Pseudomonadota bacterium]|nr:phosphate ABC transporter substrate-binding protein [Pseudomonadota bacterium]
MKSYCSMLLLLALAMTTPAHAGAVVVGSASKATPMDADAVKRVFLGRETSVGGAPAQVIYQKDGAVRAGFDKSVLAKAGPELTAYWSRLIFTGKAKAPVEVEGDAAVKAKLASNPGAVGYIADAAVDGSVKVLYKF